MEMTGNQIDGLIAELKSIKDKMDAALKKIGAKNSTCPGCKKYKVCLAEEFIVTVFDLLDGERQSYAKKEPETLYCKKCGWVRELPMEN